MTTAVPFDYVEMTARNLGFVTDAEQALLRRTPVFVCGVGGMGGAAVQSLVRAGLEHFTIADPDRFELSNLNRQVFSGVSNVGRSKVEATIARLVDINPGVEVHHFGAEWSEQLDQILPRHSVVINGMDDIAASIHLYRRARVHGITVIDAYTAPLPSVIVVHAGDPRPEERLGFPTINKAVTSLTPSDLEACKMAEAIYVLVHSSSSRHIDLRIAGDLLAGRRGRPSFAPMVITTGNLMAFEAIKVVLGRPSGVDHRGCFFNPWTFVAERPRSAVIAAIRALIVRRKLRELTRDV